MAIFRNLDNAIRSARPLGDDEIRKVAPSIYAECGDENRSENYVYIPTIQTLNALRAEGFVPFAASQNRVRDEGKRDFTRHMLRLRHLSQAENASQVGRGEFNEIILINSHDGTSAYRLIQGLFRLVCSNGMVAGNVTSDIRIAHKGDISDLVVKSAYDALNQFRLVNEHRDSMTAVKMTEARRQAFAEEALKLKFGDSSPITANQLLTPRRQEDYSDDLWTTFNVVQENIIKGGIHGRTSNGRNTTTRAVNGIGKDLRLNRDLWELAETYKLK